MITGDKMDTAESIGYSCGIFSEDTDVYKIRETNDVNVVINQMEEISKKINEIDKELSNITKMHHEDMVEKKIIPNDEKYVKYRNRYNSFNIPDPRDNLEIIYFNNKNANPKNSENVMNSDANRFMENNTRNINDNECKVIVKMEENNHDENLINKKNRHNSMIDIKTPLNNNTDGNSENDKIIPQYINR
jgi:magnesium-transporting ATPase (P-type)